MSKSKNRIENLDNDAAPANQSPEYIYIILIIFTL